MVDTDRKSGKTSFAAALAAVAIGLVALIGWVFPVDIFRSFFHGNVAMDPTSALAFILSGTSLALSLWAQHPRNHTSRTLLISTARACALVIALIGLTSLAAIILGRDFGGDQWRFPSQAPSRWPLPSRMAPCAALNFLLLGSTLLWVNAETRFTCVCVEFSAVIVGLGSLGTILCYAYGVQSLYPGGAFVPMALPTGIAFLVMSVAVLVSHADRGLLAMFAGNNAGGTTARRLLPAAVLVPVGFGWLELQGEMAGNFDSAFGNAMFALGNITIFVFLICWCANALFQIDLCRQKAEVVIRESEEKFRQLAATITDAFWITSPDLKTKLYVSPGYEAIWGRSTDSLYAHPERWIEAILPGDREHVLAAFAGLKTDKPEVSVEYQIARPDGTTRWVLNRGFQVRAADGSLIRLTGIATDITERKYAEDALDRQQTELRVLFDIVPAMICFKDTENNILRANKRFAQKFGKTVKELEGKSTGEAYPQGANRSHANDLEVIRSGLPKMGIVEMDHAPDGEERWTHTDLVPLCDADNKVKGIVVMVQDITRQKQAEREVRFNEQRYRLLVEATTSMVWDTPASGEFEVEQPGWAAFTGQSFEELRGWGWLNAVHPDDQAETKRIWSAAFAGRSTYKVEHRLLARDHTYRNMMVRAVPVLAADGTISQWFGVHTDITKRKQIEEALRLLNSAVMQSKESILITNAELDLPGPEIIFTNRAFTTMTGYTAEEALGKTPRILQGPLTDKAVLKRLRQNLEKGDAFEGEAINYRKDGTTYTQEWQIAPILDGKGKTTHFVAIMRDISERKRTEGRFRQLVDSNVQGVLFYKKNGEITGANDAFLHLVGYTREDLEAGLVDWIGLTPPEHAYRDQNALKEIAAHGVSSLYEKDYVLKDGTRVPILLASAAFADNPNEGVCFVVDLTERKALEARLYQSQKMETVGKLAGGVAHEFNSILTAIIGQSELLLGDLPAESSEAKSATEISKAAIRAASLTRQLLAYGRKQLLEPQTLDLNSVVGDMESTLRHLLGQEVDLRIVPFVGLKTVRADAGQLEQVIMNIVLNAHESMPNGGKVTLETANVSFSPEKIGSYPELKAGNYVMLAITDTGTGMSAEVKARIFEPFFSTKGVGEGTGLGLSTSYGIIKQSGGHISVYSESARGTTLKIYLPQVDDEPKPVVQPLDSPNLPRGTETILFAEDDPALRKMATTLLEKLGYRVFTAANGMEALSLKQQRDIGHIDLLFTDVVMPHMSGKELSERIQALYPHTKILFTSAFTENAFVHQGVLNQGVALLQKPFTPSVLARKIRGILDQ